MTTTERALRQVTEGMTRMALVYMHGSELAQGMTRMALVYILGSRARTGNGQNGVGLHSWLKSAHRE